MLEQEKPFTKLRLDEEKLTDRRKVVPVSLNLEELRRLDTDSLFLGQEKPSTALKQLAEIGSFVLHDEKIRGILKILTNNKRKNWRSGVIPDPKNAQM